MPKRLGTSQGQHLPGLHPPVGEHHRKGHPLAPVQQGLDEGHGVRLPSGAVEYHHGVRPLHLRQGQEPPEQRFRLHLGQGGGVAAQLLLAFLDGHDP